ncbi:MAG: hypothetical protein AAB263_16075, partial [Planctomycetota bacterium]
MYFRRSAVWTWFILLFCQVLLGSETTVSPTSPAVTIELQARRAVAEHLDHLPGQEETLAIDRVDAWLQLAARCQLEKHRDEAKAALTTACARWATMLERHPQSFDWQPNVLAMDTCRPLLEDLPKEAVEMLGRELRLGEARFGEISVERLRKLQELIARPESAGYRFGPPLRLWTRQITIAGDERG